MVHGHVFLLQVDQQPGRQTVTHDLPVVPHPVGVVPQLYLGPEGAEHDGLHVGDGEPVTSQVTEILGRQLVSVVGQIGRAYLVVQELLLHRIREVDVVVHKQVFLEEEHVMSGLPRMCEL